MKRKQNLSVGITATILLVALLFTNCQQPGISGKTLTLAINSGVEGDALKQAARDYEAQTGVHINIAEFPYANLFEKELIDLNARTGAYDLIMLDDPWFPKFASLNVLTDLTPLLQKRGQNGPDKLGREQIARQVQQTAAMLEIEPLLARKPRELSGGERQRVALARAIVRQPRAFLMDEPLSNLDARLRLQMRGELKHLQHELGTTTVYVTHDQAEAMTLGHRVAVMRKGKLQQFDTPLNIYNHPANRFVAEFVGSPSMNCLDGEFDVRARSFKAEGLELALSEVQIERLSKLDASHRVTLGIRPEHLQVSLKEQDGWTPMSVYVTELMGSETLIFLKLGREKIVARARGDFRAEVESRVWIDVDTERAHFFDPETGQKL